MKTRLFYPIAKAFAVIATSAFLAVAANAAPAQPAPVAPDTAAAAAPCDPASTDPATACPPATPAKKPMAKAKVKASYPMPGEDWEQWRKRDPKGYAAWFYQEFGKAKRDALARAAGGKPAGEKPKAAMIAKPKTTKMAKPEAVIPPPADAAAAVPAITDGAAAPATPVKMAKPKTAMAKAPKAKPVTPKAAPTTPVNAGPTCANTFGGQPAQIGQFICSDKKQTLVCTAKGTKAVLMPSNRENCTTPGAVMR